MWVRTQIKCIIQQFNKNMFSKKQYGAAVKGIWRFDFVNSLFKPEG